MVIIYLKGSRVNVLRSLILLLILVVISLLTPQGLVLFKVGSIEVTYIALTKGIYKGSLLIGSLYLSKLITSGTVKLPGSLGVFIGEIFFYFSQFSTKRKIEYKNIVKELDHILLNLNHDFNGSDITRTEKASLTPLIITTTLFTLDTFIKYNIFF